MNKIQNKVIIWACDDFNSLGLIRELVPYGVEVFFLCVGAPKFTIKSKYCSSYKSVSSLEEAKDFLLSNFSQETEKPIILTGGDDIIIFIEHYYEELKNFFILPGTTIVGKVEEYTDKNNMKNLAQNLGFLCPLTRFIKWDSDISNFKYPCIIKPSHQKPGHYNEFKFKICKSEKELKHVLSFVRHDSVFVLQEFINKECDILVYGARLWNGKTILAGSLLRDRLADSGSTSHALVSAELPQGVEPEKIEAFLEQIDYHGLFSFEYGKVESKAYFFEVNLRNDGTSDYFHQAGVNIPLAYVYSAVGLDYNKILGEIQEPRWFIDEVFDIENIYHKGGLTRKQWKIDMSAASVYKYYNKNDVEPFKWVKRRKFKQMFQDFILKRFRVYVVYVLDKMGLRK